MRAGPGRHRYYEYHAGVGDRAHQEDRLGHAVGARRRYILSQFLIEAVTLCVTGGLIGLLIGGSAALAMSIWGEWPIVHSPSLVVIALVSAGLVGMFFRILPRAAHRS